MALWGKQGRREKSKSSLARRIGSTIVALIIVGFFMIAIGYALIRNYRKNIIDIEYRGMQSYMTRLNETFILLNTSLRGTLADGIEIKNIQEAGADYQEESVLSTVKYNNAVSDLNDFFRNMWNIYGNEYCFFYYDVRRDKVIEQGNEAYSLRVQFTELITEKIREGTLQYTESGKWFLYGEYICTIFRGENGIIGSYILLDEFVRNMFSMSPTTYAQIEIYDEINGIAYLYTLTEQGTVKKTNIGSVRDETDDYYKLGNTAFACRFILGRTALERSILMPMLFTASVMIYLAVVAIVLLYIKRNILNHVKDFYDNLLKYKDEISFQEENGIVEFAAAGKILNQLNDEIRSLKIDIYEEQIQKQKVELDYAHIQIRPHFYINCLSVIHSLAQIDGTREIQNLTVLVSKYLRNILKSGTTPVTIESELDFVDNYIRALECMNDKHYVCNIHIEEELKNFSVPPLLIQTFVENSLKHNDDVEKLVVDIDIFRTEGEEGSQYCCIRISDNGLGFDEAAISALCDNSDGFPKDGHHIGMYNAIARLRLMYGETSKFEIMNGKESGALIEIQIPLSLGNEVKNEDIAG